MRRAGFTLVEVLVALVLGVMVTGSLLVFFQSQVRVFSLGVDRATLLQSSQAAASALIRDLRTAGTNVATQQPWMVYAGDSTISFHADYASNVDDPFAVYVDPDAPAGETRAILRSDRMTIPGSTFAYPDTTYRVAAGIASPAELLTFYFTRDTATARTDDYILYRQVNSVRAQPIARGLLRADTLPFFQYYVVEQDSSAASLGLLPRSALPLSHSVPLHLSQADTGRFARIDSVRAVRFNFATTNGRTGAQQRMITRTRTVWLPNAGISGVRTCGSRPLFGATPTAAVVVIDEKPAVHLTWDAATDETGGEQDVVRYVVWRHLPGAPPGDPFVSIPAGGAPYTYTDAAVSTGDIWTYTIAAQDCTPGLSALAAAGPVIIP